MTITMSQGNGTPITISIRRLTDTPAIFLAGSFSDPTWEPLELSVKPVETVKDDGKTKTTEYIFSRDLVLPEGQYQYKFREGSDGQWFYDDTVKTGRVNYLF